MDFLIRQAESKDIPRMSLLLAELFSIEADFSPDAVKQERGLSCLIRDRKDSSVVLVAEAEGEVIGMCSLQTFVSTAEGGEVGLLEDLVVRKDYRRMGAGSRLLYGILSWGRERNLSRVQLLRDIDNGESHNFYLRQGWKDTKLVCMRKLMNYELQITNLKQRMTIDEQSNDEGKDVLKRMRAVFIIRNS